MADEKKILELIEVARDTGKISKGANEATKTLEKGLAKLVAYAGDVSPKEIVMHLPLLSKEKNVPCFEIKSKEELGAAAGLGVSTSAVAIVREGEVKSQIEKLAQEYQVEAKEAVAEEKKSAEKAEKPKEEEKKEKKKADKPEETPAEEKKPEEKPKEAEKPEE